MGETGSATSAADPDSVGDQKSRALFVASACLDMRAKGTASCCPLRNEAMNHTESSVIGTDCHLCVTADGRTRAGVAVRSRGGKMTRQKNAREAEAGEQGGDSVARRLVCIII